MGKKQKSISIPLERYEELEKLYEEIKDVCVQLEISSVSELLRVPIPTCFTSFAMEGI